MIRGVQSLLQRACKCFSQLQQGAPLPLVMGQAKVMPIKHNMLFLNSKLQSFHAPALVLKGMVTLHDAVLVVLAHTWEGIYRQQMPWLSQQWANMVPGAFLAFINLLGPPMEWQMQDVLAVVEAL